MFKKSYFFGRFSVLFSFIIWFLIFSQLLRIIFFIWHYDEVSWNVIVVFRTLLTGLFYDIGTAVFVSAVTAFYLALLPNKLIGSLFDRVFIWFLISLTIFVLVFTFFAELTFWDEFKTRFNFIAVDYLIYTHEVISNIQQSYPLPLLVGSVLLITVSILILFYRRKVFRQTFTSTPSFKVRSVIFVVYVLVGLLFTTLISNDKAEWSSNRYNSEISKSGIYSFFAAFRNNQMKYQEFYTSIPNEQAFNLIRNKLKEDKSSYIQNDWSVFRKFNDNIEPIKPDMNVVCILVESLSASFLSEFGNKDNITPFLDSLAQKSVFFTNLYATGTRTVRGMEAMTLCIPPTPGQSIVKRPDNQNLYTIANVFNNRGYSSSFLYGGDGYFDNMNAYFGGNGFNIYDRGRGSVLSDQISTERYNIEDDEVTFENAWGICDEDIYNKMIKVADMHYANHTPFFNFVMTTSNHRPYTYPDNAVDIPSGKSRNGAVKYTDHALRKMFEKAKSKSWFKNTVFIIIADHCASSAGKDEIDVANYHIPAFIVNLPNAGAAKIVKQCSQIDIFPTFFEAMHWDYKSNFFGKNIFNPMFEERALVGTYRKLVLIKQNKVMVLSDQKKNASYTWNKHDNSLNHTAVDRDFLSEAIAWYQTADYLFTNHLLKK